MAPGRRRGAKGVKTKSELSLGDLVLAKVKGFPAWPAKIGRPEDWKRVPDSKKCFVQFFGTSEIAFVAPADVQAFTNEAKNKLLARCLGKTVKHFAQAVKEICDEFEELQRKNLSGARDDNCIKTHQSEARSVDPVVDEALDGNQGNRIGPECKLENKESTDVSSGLEHCLQKQEELECQDVKPYFSDDVNHRLSPSGNRNKLSSNHKNSVKDPLSVSSPLHHSTKKEDPMNMKAKSKYSDDSQNELTNGHRPKQARGSKKKSQGAVHKSGGLDIPRDHSGEVMRRKIASGGSMKLSSPDIPKLSLDVSSQKRDKMLGKGKRHYETVDDGKEDANVSFEAHTDRTSRKKLRAQHGREKQGSQPNEASSPAKVSKSAGKDANLIKAQINCKNDSRIPYVHGQMISKELKRLTSVGKAQVFRPHRVPITNESESNHHSDKDEPPNKRHCRELETSGSALISENKSGTSVSDKSDLVLPGKVQSPDMQLPLKRRSVRLCDDEAPKTPIHGGTTSKVPVTPHMSDSKKKSVPPFKSHVCDLLLLKNSGQVDSRLKEPVQSVRIMNKLLSPASQQGMKKRTKELLAGHLSPAPQQLDSEKLASMEVKPVSVSPERSPKSVGGRLSGEQESKQPYKAPSRDSRKKTLAGDINTASSDGLDLFLPNQSITERSKQPSSAEENITTPKTNSRIDDSGCVFGASDENIMSVSERLNAGKDSKSSSAVDSKISDSATSMKHLIAAAQARKRQAHLHNIYENPLLYSIPDIDVPGQNLTPATAALAFEASNTLQPDVEGTHPTPPCYNVHRISSNNENDELEERRVSSGHQGTGSFISGGTEAAVVRDAFEGMIETLSRTKESIARATRLAIDCAKYGLANEVTELLIQKLENELNLHRKVDLFFLVDSITQCSHSQRGASYVPTVQAALPRLIGAAAPAGAGAQENRRQCHKVLRLWLERKILPETVLCRYMDDIGVVSNDTSISLRCPSRAERAIHDPIREMEGMVVDEYGSNSMFQLPGFLSTNVFEEEEEDDDASDTNLRIKVDKSPSVHTPVTGRDLENHVVTPSDRRHCVLEEVDGELEMEDVSGNRKDERPVMSNSSVELASFDLNSDGIIESSLNISDELLPSREGSPPLPPGSPPMTPPLPNSPTPSSSSPPLPPPRPLSSPLPPPPPTSHQHPFPQVLFGLPQPPTSLQPHFCPTPLIGPPLIPAGPSPSVVPPPQHLRPPPPPHGPHPPPFGHPSPLGPPDQLLPQQSIPPQPPLVSQNMTPSTVPLSPRTSFQLHEVGITPTGNQQSHMVSRTCGSHINASSKGGVLPQQSFPPAGLSNALEHVLYSSSRHVDYGEENAYMNPHASQSRQQYPPGTMPFAQRPARPELPSEHPPSQIYYPTSAQQHQYQSHDPRRYVVDEQRWMQGNEINVDRPRGGWKPVGRSCSGYHDRPPESTIKFQPSAPNTLPFSGQRPVHGVPMRASRPNMSGFNWRPS